MTQYMGFNSFDGAILTRSPSSQDLLLAFADTIDGGKGDGFKLFRSHEAGFWFQFPDIAPQSPDPDNFILHTTAIDPGSGPIFFYWYDVNSVTKAATIRGRLVTKDDESTFDFGISRGRGATRSFGVSVDPRWYGDYHTAGGYRQYQYTYHYYPVWVEPDGKVHFAHVEFTMPHAPAVASAGLGYHVPHGREWMVERRKLDLSTLIFQEPIEEEESPRVPRR
jgi:hypothetical protein